MPSKYTYTEEFKLEVVTNYLQSPYGIRVVAKSYNLPSKNYITRWLTELLQKGILTSDECSAKSKTAVSKLKQEPYNTHTTSAHEKQLELENQRLKAEVAFLKKLKELERGDA
jgi:transposase